MAAAGTEEKIIQVLTKQGSFDPNILQEVGQSPLLKPSGTIDDDDLIDAKEEFK